MARKRWAEPGDLNRCSFVLGVVLADASSRPAAIAEVIRRAHHSVCYAAPGIQREPADAIVEVARRIGPELITVILDFDERVMRMGFGELDAVKTLRDAGIEVNSTPGLRTGLVIADHQGYIFTPTARKIPSVEGSIACHRNSGIGHAIRSQFNDAGSHA